jgi:gas vesicle protein
LKSLADIGTAEDELRRRLQMETPNWDPMRSHRNRISTDTPPGKSIAEVVMAKIGKQTIRKNAVLAVEILQTFSPEMSGKIDIPEWRKENRRFREKEFPGMEVFSIFHDDETTPHEQTIIVPLHGTTKEGQPKLNCRGLFGGKAMLTARLDRYAAAVRKFGLRRGIKDSGARQVSLKRMRRDDRNTQEAIEKLREYFKLPADKIWAYAPEIEPLAEDLFNHLDAMAKNKANSKRAEAIEKQKEEAIELLGKFKQANDAQAKEIVRLRALLAGGRDGLEVR